MAVTRMKPVLAVFLVLTISGCASGPRQPDWPYPEPPEAGDWGYESPSPDATKPSGSDGPYRPPYSDPDNPRDQQQPAVASHPTVLALVEKSDQQRASGDLDAAAATLERAIRIVNNDPLPWLKLAEIQFEQSNFIQAENLARRSISFAEGSAVARQAWLLIADIKRLQGNETAAREAERQAQ